LEKYRIEDMNAGKGKLTPHNENYQISIKTSSGRTIYCYPYPKVAQGQNGRYSIMHWKSNRFYYLTWVLLSILMMSRSGKQPGCSPIPKNYLTIFEGSKTHINEWRRFSAIIILPFLSAQITLHCEVFSGHPRHANEPILAS